MGTSAGVVSYMLWPVFKAGLHLRPCSTVCCCKFYKGIKPPDSSYLLKIRRWRHHDYHCSLLWINVSPTAFFAVSWVWCFFMDPSLQLSTAPRSFRFFLTFSRLTLGHAKETLAQETPHGLQHPYSGAFCVWVSVQSSNPAMTESKDLTRIKFIKRSAEDTVGLHSGLGAPYWIFCSLKIPPLTHVQVQVQRHQMQQHTNETLHVNSCH